ncbi:transposase [Thiolapillus sp.]|uniref:transposase n=1 Tax=Thiolapillus sp. TaxID=2017437 RepID=UPI003AF77093
MNTECKPEQLEFQSLGRREVIGRFDGGRITSDGGGLLLREVDQRIGLLDRLAACFTDHRNPESIEHSVKVNAFPRQSNDGLNDQPEQSQCCEDRLRVIPRRSFESSDGHFGCTT